MIDKYLSAAKDAKGQNDRVLCEVCTQHADHYARQLQLAIQNERPMPPIIEQPPMEQPPITEETNQISEPETNQISVLPFMEVNIPLSSEEEQEKNKDETEPPQKKLRRGRKPKTTEIVTP